MALLETCGKISTFFYACTFVLCDPRKYCPRGFSMLLCHSWPYPKIMKSMYTTWIVSWKFDCYLYATCDWDEIRWCSLSPDLVRWVGQAWTSRACNRCSGNLFRESYPDLLDGRRSCSGRVWLPFLDRFKKTRLGRFPFLKFSTTRAFWILTWLHDRADQ